MKNFMKKIILVVIAFGAFSCSEEGLQDYEKVSIAKIATITPEFSSFVEALELTGLTSTFEEAGDYTVFVPTNAAFAALLGSQSLEDFNTANPGVLANVLKYHVLTSSVFSKDLSNGQSVSTLLGQNFTVNISPEGEVSITDANAGTANVNTFDVECTNGLIHVIDAILHPGS